MSDKIRFVDVQGLAGAWTLGTVLTGEFELTHRVSLPGGFGDKVIAANRELVGDSWEQDPTERPEEWTPQQGVGYVCGTPPCSGFSLLNTSKQGNSRGADSDINQCMVELVTYAAKCTGLDGAPGPEIVSFESVQGAYKQGRELMQRLRSILSRDTGQRYELTHVLMSGASVGSAQMRHRYYFVAHRIPFRVETPRPDHVVTYGDAIGDLVGADLQWEDQPYPDTDVWPSDFAVSHRTDDGYFSDHAPPTGGSAFIKLINELAPLWRPGERIDEAVRRLGRKPDAVKEGKFLGFDDPSGQVLKGWQWPVRVNPHKPGYVLTGSYILSQVHWAEDRFLTVREGARMMGYPDAWRWEEAFNGRPFASSMGIGKCCPVESGKWLSTWAARAIHNAYDSSASTLGRGDVERLPDGDDEFVHNSTNAYKPVLKRQLEELNEAV